MSKKTATLAQLLESARRSEALTMQVAKAAQTALSGKASNQNLFDNWYFVDPINQRGQTKYIGGYTIDRWNLTGEGQVEIVDDGIKVTQASDYKIYWKYVFDPHIAKALAGKTVTLSCLSLSGSETFGLNIFSGDRWLTSTGSIAGVNYKTLTIPNDSTELIVLVGGIGNSAIIQAVKLELGAVQTLARQDVDGNWVLNDPPPNKALELLKCQRYYSKDVLYFSDAQDANGWAIFTIDYPTMRTTPAITGTADETNASGDLR